MAPTHQIEQASNREERVKADGYEALAETHDPPLGTANRVLTFQAVKARQGSPLASDIIIAERGEW